MVWRLLGVQPSRWHPAIYRLSVWQKRAFRALRWRLDGHTYASEKSADRLEHRVFKHTSKLIRRSAGADLALQLGKVENLRVAIPAIDGMLLRPGETFSFCKTVGRPDRARGFVEGMELSRGTARPGVGGGLCQISNLLHWLVLHSPLTLIERHHHSFDAFPDEGRVLPFGSGATVFFNYRDLRFRNDTTATFQLRLWLTHKLLEGELRSTTRPSVSYRVYEVNPRFLRRGARLLRSNEIWREVRAKGCHSPALKNERLYSNLAEVKYTPGPGTIIEDQPRAPGH